MTSPYIKNKKTSSLQTPSVSRPSFDKNKSLPIKLQGTPPVFSPKLYKKSPKNIQVQKSVSPRVKSPKPGVYYSLQSSPKPQVKGTSLPAKLSGVPPDYKVMPFDQIFWINYNSGMDIHSYVVKRIKQLKLEMEPIPSEKGQLCKIDKKNLKLFPYQIVSTVLGSPYSPLSRLLVIASTGTGKSCILTGIANYYIIHQRKHGIVFVGASDALYTNFIKQSMECPGKMKEIADEHEWTDSENPDHVQSFMTHMKKYIFPVDYTKFANMISGKYKKYKNKNLDDLNGKVILFDEAHYLVDSINDDTFTPTYQRMPASWQMNLRNMYNILSQPNNPYLKDATIIGATATPITQSIMEYFSLVNLFAHRPVEKNTLNSILKNVNKIEQGILDESKLNDCISIFKNIIKESVTMYIAKTSKKVLDTSIFPKMEFQNINVPLTSEQARLIYTNKNYIMADF